MCDLGACLEDVLLNDAKYIHPIQHADQCTQECSALYIHLLDTGGQPSFQDVLPKLLQPSTVHYVLIFNAAQDLQ